MHFFKVHRQSKQLLLYDIITIQANRLVRNKYDYNGFQNLQSHCDRPVAASESSGNGRAEASNRLAL